MKAFFLLFFLAIWILPAQDNLALPGELGRGAVPGYESQIGIVIKEVPIKGSPYFNDMYTVGETFVNGRNVRLLMRYNAFSDQIEMKDKYQKSFNLLRRTDLQAKFGGKTYKLLDYVEFGKKQQGYFVPLNEGHAVLLHKPRKMFVQAEKPENGYDTYNPPVYRDVSAYYLQIGSAEPVEIALNKRQLLRNLNQYSASLKQYISDNNLKLKSEAEAIKLLNYYNSLRNTDKSKQVNS